MTKIRSRKSFLCKGSRGYKCRNPRTCNSVVISNYAFFRRDSDQWRHVWRLTEKNISYYFRAVLSKEAASWKDLNIREPSETISTTYIDCYQGKHDIKSKRFYLDDLFAPWIQRHVLPTSDIIEYRQDPFDPFSVIFRAFSVLALQCGCCLHYESHDTIY